MEEVGQANAQEHTRRTGLEVLSLEGIPIPALVVVLPEGHTKTGLRSLG